LKHEGKSVPEPTAQRRESQTALPLPMSIALTLQQSGLAAKNMFYTNGLGPSEAGVQGAGRLQKYTFQGNQRKELGHEHRVDISKIDWYVLKKRYMLMFGRNELAAHSQISSCLSTTAKVQSGTFGVDQGRHSTDSYRDTNCPCRVRCINRRFWQASTNGGDRLL
jgi:hypothetical protein